MLNTFAFQNKILHVEDVAIPDIIKQVGTPVYIYSTQRIVENFRQFQQAFQEISHLICYAVKANSNLSILHLLAQQGAGADIVSGGELYRALKAGIPPEKIVYSGVGKTAQELVEALQAGVSRIHLESLQEFELLCQIVQDLQIDVQLAPRINPDIDAQTHPFISTGLRENKFGMSVEEAKKVFERAPCIPYLRVTGISLHIGSQITQITPFLEAIKFLVVFIEEQRKNGFQINTLDVGGGLGIVYHQEIPPSAEEYGKALLPLLKPLQCQLILEPGRAIVGNAGILITKVLYTKRNAEQHFTIVDAAMTDCLRPALYKAYHEILCVNQHQDSCPPITTDIVGPVCESSDFLAQNRQLPEPRQGNLIALLSVGAYGFTMASHYNSRPNIPEVLVNGREFFVIRKRETYEDLIRRENILRIDFTR